MSRKISPHPAKSCQNYAPKKPSPHLPVSPARSTGASNFTEAPEYFQKFQKLIEDDPLEVKVLKIKILDLEIQKRRLNLSLERTKLRLAQSNVQVVNFRKKLQFVKDHKYVFDMLRETYINVKYNEATGRNMKKVKNKSVQTWNGILCRACLDTERMRVELKRVRDTFEKEFNNDRGKVEEVKQDVSL